MKLKQTMAKFWYDPDDAKGRVPVLLLVEKADLDDLTRLTLDGDAGDDLLDQVRMHVEDIVHFSTRRAVERGKL